MYNFFVCYLSRLQGPASLSREHRIPYTSLLPLKKILAIWSNKTKKKQIITLIFFCILQERTGLKLLLISFNNIYVSFFIGCSLLYTENVVTHVNLIVFSLSLIFFFLSLLIRLIPLMVLMLKKVTRELSHSRLTCEYFWTVN